ERRRRRELVELLVRPDERILAHVLRLGVAAEHPAGNPEDSLVVAAHEHGEGITLAAQHLPDQGLIGEVAGPWKGFPGWFGHEVSSPRALGRPGRYEKNTPAPDRALRPRRC